jgi:hypothetical protein
MIYHFLETENPPTAKRVIALASYWWVGYLVVSANLLPLLILKKPMYIEYLYQEGKHSLYPGMLSGWSNCKTDTVIVNLSSGQSL